MTAPTEDDLDHVGSRDQLQAAQQEIDQLRQGLEAHAVIARREGS